MAVHPERLIKGSRFTEHFTLDDSIDQVVPKSGTNTYAGALMLNTGANPANDATNATKAITAAGFIALATQVDGDAPFCGNAIQQSIVTAFAQAIACNPAAQQALGCAIANNPTAAACLVAAI